MTRRAKVTLGLPAAGRRRVAGLRREEVAQPAGVSTECYIQVECERVAGVSDEVLHAVARTLLPDIGESDTNTLIRRAYEAKYRDQPSALEPMVAPTAAETTLRVTAAG